MGLRATKKSGGITSTLGIKYIDFFEHLTRCKKSRLPAEQNPNYGVP